MNWNDVKFVLAVHEHGTLPEAAEALQVNHTTVWRRIQSLEKEIGAQLFLNDRQGYRLTDVGMDVIHYAKNVADNMDAIDRLVTSQSKELEGVIRLTAPSQAANDLLPSLLKEFQTLYPQIQFELILDNAKLDLEKREADVAIRGAEKVPDNLIGRCLGRISWSLFVHEELYPGRLMTIDEIKQLPMIGYQGFQSPAGRWYSEYFGNVPKTIICSEPDQGQGFAEAGMGVALLPSYIETSSKKIFVLPQECGIDLWLLTHKEMRTSLKIKTFWEFLLQQLEEDNLVRKALEN